MKAISKVIIKYNDKYLLYLRDNTPEISFADHRDLFGGWVEEGENPLECAVRELQEELVISIDPSELNFIETANWDTLECHVYEYEMPESLIDNLVLWEWQEMRRYTQSEIQSLKLVYWYRKYFE